MCPLPCLIKETERGKQTWKVPTTNLQAKKKRKRHII